MKKGVKIYAVEIYGGGMVKAYTSDMTEIRLTRSQRKALSDYKNPEYLENVQKEFSRKDLFDDDFTVMKDGEIRYRMNGA